ncbi:MAG: HK97 family phage prohead protease [Micrococcus sp.]|nr:HK97 family phage prohead protease [Micrococcus sp.]
MHIKGAALQVKAAGTDDGLEDGQFTAYASVFGNVDSYGDIVVAGAFAETLKDWEASGNVIPVLFGHNMSDPDYNVGHVVKAEEDEHGLLVTVQLDLETAKGAQVYRLVKGRRVSQMSFAYEVLDAAPVEKDGVEAFELRRLKLYEVSVVPIGANQETEILTVKAAAAALAGGVKEGRVLAAKHIDSLRAAAESIGAVIAAAEGKDQEKASGPARDKDEEPAPVKSKDPQPVPSVVPRAAALEAEILAL